MKQRIYFLLIIFLLINPFYSKGQEYVIITEIKYNSSSENEEGKNIEYIELYNTGLDKVDLSGWELLNRKNQKWIIPSETVIYPKAFILLAYNNEQKESAGLPYLDLEAGDLSTVFYFQEEITYNKASFPLMLTDNTGKKKEEILYIDTDYPAFSGQAFYSVQRTGAIFDKDGKPAFNADEWEAATITPLSQNVNFTEPEIMAASLINISYYYDLHGNCIQRNRTISISNPAKTQRNEEDMENESGILYEDEEVNLVIYPNPTKGELYIEIPDFNENEKLVVSIFDMKGKRIHKLQVQETDTHLDLANYANGTYILQINRNGKLSSWKIIKID